MHKKALTVAIAGALAAPMAAQAVEVSISGHVSRALYITDSDSGSKATVADDGNSGSRFRFSGTGEMMDGRSAGVKLEYAAGGDGFSTLSLRYADINFAGEFGKVSIGHGDQGGEGSVYNDKSGTFGTGHGNHPLRGRLRSHDAVSAGVKLSLLRLARRRRSPQRSDPLRHPRVRPGLGGPVGRQRRRGLRRGQAEPGLRRHRVQRGPRDHHASWGRVHDQRVGGRQACFRHHLLGCLGRWPRLGESGRRGRNGRGSRDSGTLPVSGHLRAPERGSAGRHVLGELDSAVGARR